ncbi:hypothetical protein ACOU9P_000555 [Enterococcus faecium]|uniref:hypothetical protein n=1 Tax=Enterococcus sp. 10F3_DIV0382 TaxID=1834165 RepID=UPI000B66E91C|nr:hypothetical protein [Enterococcus sp. 10F3_DIV0382]EGP4954540.1 hypothetical protein [Enterococcus faecium]EGP5033953.1 hypothetical protein [Enterococcus faecium]EJF8929204.1 hypothetical protein [Enterococcus faecium]ELY8215290.1 hypothetical protein [Enterococcus faecium]EMC2433344.1 hypothetical protein [Enterococcus faecium]
MKYEELTISKSGAQLLAESKFKPFVPSQRQENNKKQLTDLFKKNLAASARKKELVGK